MASLRAKSRLLWHLSNASRCRVSLHALKVTSGGESISCIDESGGRGTQLGFGARVGVEGFEAQRSCLGTRNSAEEDGDEGCGDERGERNGAAVSYGGLGFGAQIRVFPLDTHKRGFATKNWSEEEAFEDEKRRRRDRSNAAAFSGGNGGSAQIWVSRLDTHKRWFATKTSSLSSSEESDSESDSENREPRERDVKWHVDKLCPTSLRVRLMKELDFDDIIEREKKLKIVLKIKDLLMADPSRTMELQDLGKCRDFIGLTGNKRIIAFLKRYPEVFQVFENPDQGKLPWFQFSPEADALCNEEVEIRKSMMVDAVTKLRKLLMMAGEKRLLLGKIAHIAKDLGLPEDFRKRLVFKFPKYFHVVEGEDVTNEDFRVLELVKWSDRLAVTVEEEKVRAYMKEHNLDKPPRLEIQLPKRYRLSNKDKFVLYKFHELECPSPYESSSYLDPASAEAEKRAVLLIKELLSLTLEKRIYVDHLTHFRKEFKFSNQVRGLLIRHPEHFYVSRKGARDTVFFREAYQQIHVPGERQRHELKEKHPLVILKEKYFALMEVKRVQQSPDPQEEPVSQENQEESTLQEETDLPEESASSISV